MFIEKRKSNWCWEETAEAIKLHRGETLLVSSLSLLEGAKIHNDPVLLHYYTKACSISVCSCVKQANRNIHPPLPPPHSCPFEPQ